MNIIGRLAALESTIAAPEREAAALRRRLYGAVIECPSIGLQYAVVTQLGQQEYLDWQRSRGRTESTAQAALTWLTEIMAAV